MIILKINYIQTLTQSSFFTIEYIFKPTIEKLISNKKKSNSQNPSCKLLPTPYNPKNI